MVKKCQKIIAGFLAALILLTGPSGVLATESTLSELDGLEPNASYAVDDGLSLATDAAVDLAVENPYNLSAEVEKELLAAGEDVQTDGGACHSLTLKEDGTVWAFGENDKGQLGNGTSGTEKEYVRVTGLENITAVAGGGANSMALKEDGTVWYWGSGVLSPVQAKNLTGITAISAGDDHFLALKEDNTVWAWGANGWGQLGNGTYNNSDTPVQVLGLTDITAIAAGQAHSIALGADGRVWAWGDNRYGQLGNGTWTERNIPMPLSELSGITEIYAIDFYSLATDENGTTWFWGANGAGQKGVGEFVTRNTPEEITFSGDDTAVRGAKSASTVGNIGVQAELSDGTSWAFVASMYSGITVFVTWEEVRIPQDKLAVSATLSNTPANACYDYSSSLKAYSGWPNIDYNNTSGKAGTAPDRVLRQYRCMVRVTNSYAERVKTVVNISTSLGSNAYIYKPSATTNYDGEMYFYLEYYGNRSCTLNATALDVTGSCTVSGTNSVVYANKFYLSVYCYAVRRTGSSWAAFESAVNMQGTGYDEETGTWYTLDWSVPGNTKPVIQTQQPQTNSQTTPTEYRTIAVDNPYILRENYVSDGSPSSQYHRARVKIAGITGVANDTGYRTAEDSGDAINGYHIDVFIGFNTKDDFNNIYGTKLAKKQAPDGLWHYFVELTYAGTIKNGV